MKSFYAVCMLIALAAVLSYCAHAVADEAQKHADKAQKHADKAQKHADEAQKHADEAQKQLIRDKVAAFQNAFNRHDAKAAAATWMPDGKWYIGARVVLSGRNDIEAYLAQTFTTNKDLKLITSVESIAFVTPNLALADGFHEGKIGTMTGLEKTKDTTVFIRDHEEWMCASLLEWVQPTGPVLTSASGDQGLWFFMLAAVVSGAIILGRLWYKEMRKPSTT
jgi:uncharacterized protein (TIGR02246 family)